MYSGLPVFSRDFSSTPFLQQLRPHFAEYYYGVSDNWQDLLYMAADWAIPDDPSLLPADWHPWLESFRPLKRWADQVEHTPQDPRFWQGLRQEGMNLLREENLQDRNVELMHRIAGRLFISIVWFEETVGLGVQTLYYPSPYPDVRSLFVYMARDSSDWYYALRHFQHRDLASESIFRLPGQFPPVVLDNLQPDAEVFIPQFPTDPDELFLQFSSEIVKTVINLPSSGNFSLYIREDVKRFITDWSGIERKLPHNLAAPLDKSRLLDTLKGLQGPNEPTEPKNNHQLKDCGKYPEDTLIEHYDHCFHQKCLRNYTQERRKLDPNSPVNCPLCPRPLHESLVEQLNKDMADDRTKLLQMRIQ